MKLKTRLLLISSSIIFTYAIFGCSNSTEPKPDPLVLQLDPTHVSVYGGSDGTIDLTVTGGAKPYQYNWSNGETTEDVNNLIADTYTVTVTDESDQTETDSIVVTEPANPSDVTITDYDGNIYSTVVIGNQLWLAENWKCTHAQDGSTLNGVYAYNDDENYVAEYGRLYTWQAALNTEPQGWHLPNDEDWNILISELGNEAGTKIKEGGSSGFNAKLSGYRYYGGGYADIDRWGIYWSSTPVTNDHSNVINVFHDQYNIVHSGLGINAAISVRYVRN